MQFQFAKWCNMLSCSKQPEPGDAYTQALVWDRCDRK